MGRHKVRAALDRLHSDGLVQIEPNRGATVKSLDLVDVLDILIAREALEAGVAYLAAARIEASQLQQLEECLDIMRAALREGEYDRYSATNRRFHQVIYEASGNKTLPELIISLQQRLVRLQLRAILIPGHSEKSLAEHAARAHLSSLRMAIQKAWQLIRL